jgi:hypothetical protein
MTNDTTNIQLNLPELQRLAYALEFTARTHPDYLTRELTLELHSKVKKQYKDKQP